MSYTPVCVNDIKKFDVILIGAMAYVVKEIKQHGFVIDMNTYHSICIASTLTCITLDGENIKIIANDRTQIYTTKSFSPQIEHIIQGIMMEAL